MGASKEQLLQRLGEWRTNADVEIRAQDLRLPWLSDVPSVPGKHNAHFLGLDMVATCMNSLSLEARQQFDPAAFIQFADVLRSRENVRPMVPERNTSSAGVERVIEGRLGGDVAGPADLALSGFQLSKVRKIADIIYKHEHKIPLPLLRAMVDRLAPFTDENGRSVVDRRRLKAARIPGGLSAVARQRGAGASARAPAGAAQRGQTFAESHGLRATTFTPDQAWCDAAMGQTGVYGQINNYGAEFYGNGWGYY
ncbi:unnamed protein product [Pedinophyceae sp. YPF-701]|nr:unnamed protein product [Pedinophyceae sp. YPF-701]